MGIHLFGAPPVSKCAQDPWMFASVCEQWHFVENLNILVFLTLIPEACTVYVQVRCKQMAVSQSFQPFCWDFVIFLFLTYTQMLAYKMKKPPHHSQTAVNSQAYD